LKDHKVIVFSARVHPSETNSSYVLKGLMDEFCKIDSQAGEYLRENYIVVIIPMLNPDGVSIGNSRTSLSGYDLNRCWKNPDRFIHPEIYYTKKLMANLGRQNKLVFFTDFHGHEKKEGCFMYGCNVSGSSKATREFPVMLYELCNHFEKDHCK
jgi:murein tripeptide amidase MpaA